MQLRCKFLLLAVVLCSGAQAFEPAINYALQCMGCHTPDGSAVPGRVPAIRTTLLAFAGMPAGRQFLVQVPGSAQSVLSNAELAELLNWMIQNLGGGPGRNDYTRFTEKEVAEYRTSVVVDVRATRERLLAAIGR